MELWFVLAILTAALWGADGIFAKLSTPRLGVARIAILIVPLEAMMYFLGFYFWRSNVPFRLEEGFLAEVSCMIGMIGYLCYFESMVDGQVAIIGTISAGYPALTVIGAIVFLSETLSVTQGLAVIAIVGGVVALSYEPNPGSQNAISRRSVLFALLAFAFWGIWGLTSKIVIGTVGVGNIFGLYVISSLTVPSVLSLALETGLASLVFPISSAYPLVTVILAIGLLHEKLNRLHVIALFFVILGLIGIGIAA
jgi:uncharacterized membrane protein